MLSRYGLSVVAVALLLPRGSLADDVEYIDEMSAYSLLAPCAQSALSYAVGAQTNYNSCGEEATAIQECICSNSDLSREVTSSWSSEISTSCGGLGASEDQTSASRVFDKYCNPKIKVEFPTPTTHVVNAYITDMAEIDYLPPCASDGLSYAVMSMSMARCPESASLFASCVCSKSGVTEDISTTIRRSVRSSCGNDEDVTSAYDFYDAYCNMQSGTTSFAKPASPPGDMSYYITALSQFESLAVCAQEGVQSAVSRQTANYCGKGPQALASCVCIKSGMSEDVLSELSSEVRWGCDNTATHHVTSAMDVFSYYCSAAKDEVTATVDQSVAQTYATEASRTGSGSGPEPTGNDDGDSGDSQSQGNGDEDSGGGGGGSNKTATIAASVMGAVIGIALIVGVAWWIRRRRLKAKAAQAERPSSPPSVYGNPELHGNDSPAEVSKTGTPVAMEQHPRAPELSGRDIVELGQGQPTPELMNHTRADQYVQPAYEMYSPLSNTDRGSTSPQTTQNALQPEHSVSPTSHTQSPSGMTWQSGPIDAYDLGSQATQREDR